ncbi:n-dimethylarginine dimethylaminohydrolase [Ceraceosorus bombacis]|uniref:N-dimethylarginine dimethylaminohydrolase n=1 Tax=Ceraceosorus bombacis TaxID=401625 RepID=A0A0P1BBI0_9BASI|nr:n-dimethylarginine dimethylaminohydrolase [Ceraceosorus bombacis]
MAAPVLLVRRPSPELAKGLLTHISDDRASLSNGLASQQWQEYTDVFRAHGWDVREVQAADECPDGVFIEDALLWLTDFSEKADQGAAIILTNTPAPSRAKELSTAQACAKTIATAHGAKLYSLKEIGGSEAHLEGGDVLKVGRVVYVNSGGHRTNEAGICALRSIAEPIGYSVVGIPIQGALHLKSAVTALPDGTVIGHMPGLQAFFKPYLQVPEPEGVAVVHLRPYEALASAHDDQAEAHLVMSSSAPRTTALLESLGWKVTTTDVTEFEVR